MNKAGFLETPIVRLVLAIIVLSVVLLILGWHFKAFASGINDCEAKGGECIDAKIGCEYGPSFIPGCKKDVEVCCLKTDNDD